VNSSPKDAQVKLLSRLADFARGERARKVADGEGIHLAKDYHTGLGHVEQFRRHVLPRLRRCGDLTGCRVLEVGAGAAYMATMLAATEVAHVVATDYDWKRFSPRSPFLTEAFRAIRDQWSVERGTGILPVSEIVSLASGRATFNTQRLVLVQADGARLPFGDDAFDVVFAHGCLEHFPDLEGVFGEMLRVLRPDGLLYAESEKFWGARDGSHLYEVFPAPWLHLLASTDVLWKMYETEWGGKDILWPGRFVDREYIFEALEHDLNRRGVRPIKKMLLESGCDLVFWQQMSRPEDHALLRQLGLRRALRDWPLEELLTSHLAFGLRKRPARFGTRVILRSPWILKRAIPESLKRLLRRRLEA